jgi:nicotinamide mononucleotide transporter
LQTLYVGMAVYGFWQWSDASSSRAGVNVIRRWPASRHAASAVLIVLVANFLAPWLPVATAGSWPRLDAAVTCASLLATWMTTRSVLENWLYWMIVNTASMFLYGAQGLWFVVGLYALYLVIAVIGWREWQARYRVAETRELQDAR